MSTSLRVNVAIAAFALVLFEVVGLASGRLEVRDGLGWDGAMYARMVAGRLTDGTANTAVRPLIVLAARIPYRLGLDVVRSFEIVNALSAFVVYLVAALLLQRGGLDAATRALVVANLAMTIAVSKMFGFYPTLIDLGAMAVIASAFYLAATDRFRLAAVVCMLATASREFGMAAPLFAAHRAVRLGRWRDALLFFPAVVVPFVIRLPALGIVPEGQAPLSPAKLLSNLALWREWPFVVAFTYFAVTLLGGITVLLLVRPQRVFARFRAQPELATFAAVVIAATVVGDADISRYLVFVLPVALVLVGPCLDDIPADSRRGVLAMMTLVTLLTQRPLQPMTADSYFLDWFPLYRIPDAQALPPEIVALWLPRLVSLVFVLAAGFLVVRHARRAQQYA